jgi:hypothetical protein
MFTLSPVPPGTYCIEVESAGYKRAQQDNIVIATTAPATVNVTLVPGKPSDVVKFTATAPAIQTDNGMIHLTLNEAQLKQLPVIDRNHQELIGLQTGITPPIPLFSVPVDPDRNRYFATNGQTELGNSFSVDGLNSQEPFRAAEIRVQPVESLHDMLTSTSNYTEDKGFAIGAVVNTTTMSGTNQIHGSLFEFNSNNDLKANNFFNVPNNSQSRLVYNQFGATVGGALRKDRTFGFASYEGTYRRGTQTVMSTVPTAAVVGGNFSGIPGLTLYSPSTGAADGTGRTAIAGNIINPALINPTAAAIASFLPAPNQLGLVNNLVTNVPLQDDLQRFDGRIDQTFSGNTSAFLRYGYTNGRGLQGSPLGNVIGASTRGRIVGQMAAINLTHTFSPSTVAEGRFGYNRYTNALNPASDLTPLAGTTPFAGFTGQLFAANIPGIAPIGTFPGSPSFGVDNTFNWIGTVSHRRGIHDIRGGLDVRRIRSDGFGAPPFGVAGTANFGPGATMLNSPATTLTSTNEFFNSFAAFLLGAPSQVGQSSFTVPPSIRQTQWGMWIGDHINVTSRLALDLGLRYEIYTALSPSNSGGAAFYNPFDNTFRFAGIGGVGRSPYSTDYDSVAPRFGFAYRFNDKTVVRGGYGISYYQPAYIMSGLMPPIVGATNGVTGTFATAPLVGGFTPSFTSGLITNSPSITNGVSAGNVPVRFMPGSVDTPYAQSFSLEVQHEFLAGTVLSAAYVGTLGRHLPFNSEFNAAPAGTGVAGMPLSPFGRTATTQFYDTALTNNYNSLQARLTRRFTRGLSFVGSYTYSKALGFTTSTGTLLQPTNLNVNYGPLDYDRQSILSIGHVWELPFGHNANGWRHLLLGGWQLNGVLTWHTGTPLTAIASPLLCNCPGNNVLAGLNGTVSPTAGESAPFVLNPAAFSIPVGATFSNLDRGALRGDSQTNYNLAAFKRFNWHDRWTFEFRGEAYNISNTPHFVNPVTAFPLPNFGQSLATIEGNGNRQLNVALRILF